MTTTLVIKSEEDFLNYAYGVLFQEHEVKTLSFDGWPIVELDIKGKRYHSSLPTKLMEGLIGFQQEVDKAYASLLYGTSNRQKLTNADKDILELVFTIKEGSTGASGGDGGWFNGFWDKLDVVCKDMTGTQKTSILVIVTLAFGGYFATKNFTDAQTKQHAEEQRTEQITALTEMNNKTVEAMRDSLMAKAVELAPTASGTEKVVEHMEEGYKNVVKSVQDADELQIGATKFNKAQIMTISAKPDVVKDVDESVGEFFIDSISKKRSDYLIASVQAVDSELSFNLKVDRDFLKEDENAALHDAFYNETSIKINYQAKLKNGEIAEARLINVIIEDLQQVAQVDVPET
ncbi:TPA: hypothetical protein ACGUWG_004121 [Vibrio vulnificus]